MVYHEILVSIVSLLVAIVEKTEQFGFIHGQFVETVYQSSPESGRAISGSH